jgi:two-component system, response regulator PdtaR
VTQLQDDRSIDDAAEAAQTVVLLVEDEPLVRMCAAETLEDEGFEVIEAATAPAALKILEKRDDVTAVFTDIDMPGGMNGLELARIVHTRWPHIALVVTSGVCRVGADNLPGDGVFIGKPYSASAPVRIIRELVRQRSAGYEQH